MAYCFGYAVLQRYLADNGATICTRLVYWIQLY